MDPFFYRFKQIIPVHISEILPDDQTPPEVARRAVYEGLVYKLPDFYQASIQVMVDGLLRPHRNKACSGSLGDEDLRQMIRTMHLLMDDFRLRFESFPAYKMINAVACGMAMILFVDNCIKEGIGSCAHEDHGQTLEDLAGRIQSIYAAQSRELDPQSAHFYASYFLWQTVFDKIFVGDEAIVFYDGDGSLHTTPRYGFYTSYLELANSRILKASEAEKTLSYLITTGWRDGIDVDTWNALNKDYYSRSDDNFFSADYDHHLDRMLPQFPKGRARAAASVVERWNGEEPITLVEVGAGSGSFAVDLFMAVKSQGKDVDKLTYHGLEPSGAMMEVFREHFHKRTGVAVPAHWCLVVAGLEELVGDVSAYLKRDRRHILVFSYSAHHCYRASLQKLLADHEVARLTQALYILDGTLEHGWTKWTYMPLDCRSPEDFDNVAITGNWASETLWHEPQEPLDHHALSNAWAALRRLTPPVSYLFQDSDPAFLVDLDGTIYRGEEAIPGALAFLQWLAEEKVPYLLFTNRSERTPQEVVDHLKRLGLNGVHTSHIYTSAQATADLLDPGKAYVVGGQGLRDALIERGFQITDDNPDYVIMGLDQTVDYQRLARAVTLVLGGARFVVTNNDKRLSTEDGFGPGNGAIAAAVATATGKVPFSVGKPEPPMYRAAVKRLGVAPHRVFVVGDNLETDIRGGLEQGLKTVLVLTGVTDQNALDASDIRPHLVLQDLQALVNCLSEFGQ